MISNRKSQITDREGFTLIELMLAVALLAIMMSVIYGVVVSTVQAQERIEEITAGTEIGPAILTQIRQDLEAAFIPAKDKATVDYFVGQDRKGSQGDRDRLDFVAAVSSYGAEDEYSEPRFHTMNEVGYSVTDSRSRPGEGVLYRREDLWIDAEPLKDGALTMLYDRVKEFNVEYWDGQSKKWMPTWSSKQQKGELPGAFKIVLKLRVADSRAPEGVGERTYALTITRPE